jgi:hypothetical protein
MKSFMIRAAVLLSAVLLTTGCMGTRAAYKEARVSGSLSDYAYVIQKHYDALGKEAVRLKQNGTLNGSALTKVQQIDSRAAPAVLKLGPLAEAYESVKDAKTQKELQEAVDKAVIEVAAFSREIIGLGGAIGELQTQREFLMADTDIGLVPIYE